MVDYPIIRHLLPLVSCTYALYPPALQSRLFFFSFQKLQARMLLNCLRRNWLSSVDFFFLVLRLFLLSLCRIGAIYGQLKDDKTKWVYEFKSHVNTELCKNTCSICTFAGHIWGLFDKSIFSNNTECMRHAKVMSWLQYWRIFLLKKNCL